MPMMNENNSCPSIYQEFFSKPLFLEQLIIIIYAMIFLIGLIGNIMTIVIIRSNAHLRTPTNFYLLNLAVSDLMMLMGNLPLEMLEIAHREWPLSIVFCKLRNICAEFFTCSSILTIFAFTCERYFAIVRPVHLHRLSHFRRARNIILIIWMISLAFSLPLGLAYEIQLDPVNACKSCLPKRSLAKLLSIIIIISSLCLFYLPMFIIGAIYLFIGKALRRVTRFERYSTSLELSSASHSMYAGLSNRDGGELRRPSCSWLKMRARWQARRVMIKTLVAVVIAFFVCYAPMYLQRLLLAIANLTPHSNWSVLASFMAYLYVISGVTFYFGSVINPILYNVVSNKYRQAFRDLFCCHWKTIEKPCTSDQRLYPAKYLISSNPNCTRRKTEEHFAGKTKRYSYSFNYSEKHRRYIPH